MGRNMEPDWNVLGLFFAKGTRLVALPHWRKPRLVLEAGSMRTRWRDARLFDAYSLKGRLRRSILRNLAPLLPARDLLLGSAVPAADHFMDKLGLPVARRVVIVGYNDQRQKWVAIGLDKDSTPIAYLKYGERPRAIQRIDHEARTLEALPTGTGPAVLLHADLGPGRAFVMQPVAGCSAGLDPFTSRERDALFNWIDRLSGSQSAPIREHPAIHRIHQSNLFSDSRLNVLLEALSCREWPVGWQHGDATPWNLLHPPAAPDILCAIDWEDAVADGMPLFDLVYYVLQAHFLLRRGRVEEAVTQARAWLGDRGLTSLEADALIRLGACDAWLRWRTDGWEDQNPIQQFRLAVANHPLPNKQ